MVIGRGLVAAGSAGFGGALPTSSSAQYPRGGVGIWLREHSFARPTPEMPKSWASWDIGFFQAMS